VTTNITFPKERFWAGTTKPEELIEYCVARRDAFQDLQVQSGNVDKAYKNWQLYGGMNEAGISGKVSRNPKDETASIFVNHLRANTRIILQYTVGQQPTWTCQSANDSPEALEATKTGDRLLPYFWDQRKFYSIMSEAAETALVYRSAYILREWDETAGKAVGVIDQEKKLIRYEGRIRGAALNPWQIAFDTCCLNWRDVKWVMWGDLVLKWDLAQIYWDRREKIWNCSLERGNKFYGMEYGIVPRIVTDDYIWRWTFVHLPTPSLPQGRFLRFVGDEIPLVFGPCPEYYGGVPAGSSEDDMPKREPRNPLVRLVHSETLGSILSGHSPVDDGAPLQEALNAQISMILSNHMKFGRWKYRGKYGDYINIMDLSDGDVVQTEGDFDVLAPPGSADLVGMGDKYVSMMGAVMGVAEASRGVAPSNETAALSLAIQDSSTVTNNRGFDNNFREASQEVGQGIIEILQVVATPENPQTASVIGENNLAELITFTAEKLQPVTRVLVQPESPMLRLNSGRIGFLETILAKFPQLVSNESEILTALETGNFRGVFRANDEQLALAKREGQLMRKGVKVVPQTHEHQILHIRTHTADLASTREDQDSNGTKDRLQTHLALHIQEISKPSTQALMVVLGYTKPAEMASFQQILMMAAGPMGMPTGAPPEGPGGPPTAPPTTEPGGSQGLQPAVKETVANAGAFMKDRASESPMNQAAQE
jgi:hypothetical protein